MNISDIILINVDKVEEMWLVEGEAIFDGHFSTAFAASFYPDDEELDALEFVVPPPGYNHDGFLEMLMTSLANFDYDE